MAVVGNLVVNLKANSASFTRDMKKAGVRVKSFAKDTFTLRNAMVAMAGAAGVGYAAKKIFDLGASVEETGSKFRTVFGPNVEQAQKFLDKFATAAGLSNTEGQELLATTGAIVQGMGLAGKASADFAQDAMTLAADLSSFNNIPITETSRTIQAALAGERESLKRLGIVVMEADVQKRALLDTGKEMAKQLTQEDKALATLALITERAGVAVGDLDRTQASAANTARRVRARFQDLKETIASELLPTMGLLLGAIDDNAGGFKTLSRWVRSAGKGLRAVTREAQIASAHAPAVLEGFKFFLLKKLGFEDAATRSLQKFVGLAKGAKEVTFEIVRAAKAANEMAAAVGGGERTADPNDLAAAFARAGEASIVLGGGVQAVSIKTLVLRDNLSNAAGELGVMKTTALDFASSFADSVADSVRSGMDAFKRFADYVIAQLIRIAAKFAIFKALSAIFPGSGGLIGTALGFSRASGGPVAAGSPYVVGERGPELFVPKSSGDIVPGGGGVTVNLQLVTQDGRDLGNLTYRQKRDEALDRAITLPVPLMAVS